MQLEVCDSDNERKPRNEETYQHSLCLSENLAPGHGIIFIYQSSKVNTIKIYEEARSLVQKMTLTPHHVIAGEGRVSLKVPSAKRDEWRWVVVALKNVSSSSMNLETCKPPPRLRSSYNLALAKLKVVHLMQPSPLQHGQSVNSKLEVSTSLAYLMGSLGILSGKLLTSLSAFAHNCPAMLKVGRERVCRAKHSGLKR